MSRILKIVVGLLLLATTCLFFLGCKDHRTGGRGSLPPATSFDDSRETLLPMAVQAAFLVANKEFGSDSSWFFSFEEKGHRTYRMMKEKSNEFAKENPQLVPRPDTKILKNGKRVHKDSGAPVLMLRIGDLEDVDPSSIRRLRYRIDFSSGLNEASFYVYFAPEFYPVEHFEVDNVVSVEEEQVIEETN